MSTTKSLLWVVTSFAALLIAFSIPPGSQTALVQSFNQLKGGYWYRLEYRNRDIGAYSSESARTREGYFRFHTRLSFALPGSGLISIEQSIIFDSKPPQNMIRAELRETSDGKKALSVDITRNAHTTTPGLVGTIDRNGDSTTRELTWTYTLSDHLALESWLRQAQPEDQALLHAMQIDVGSMALRPLTWQLVSRSDEGYLIRNRSPLEDTLYLLDARMIPQNFTLGGLFHLYRVAGPDAAHPPAPYRRISARIPVDRSLGDPTRVARLRLKINEAAALPLSHEPSLRIDQRDNFWVLEIDPRRKRPVSDADTSPWLQEEVLYPIYHPRIQGLLHTFALESPPGEEIAGELLKRLTAFVHQRLRYDETTTPVTILDALEDGAGDCTEFADLFTTLARAAGLPARTVTGLAYSDQTSERDPGPGFALHSWSEVAIDGTWQPVDPTWNETRLDATHIPFPRAPSKQLQAIATIPEMRFEVLEVEID